METILNVCPMKDHQLVQSPDADIHPDLAAQIKIYSMYGQMSHLWHQCTLTNKSRKMQKPSVDPDPEDDDVHNTTVNNGESHIYIYIYINNMVSKNKGVTHKTQ